MSLSPSKDDIDKKRAEGRHQLMQDIKGAIIEGNEDGKYAKKVKVAGSK